MELLVSSGGPSHLPQLLLAVPTLFTAAWGDTNAPRGADNVIDESFAVRKQAHLAGARVCHRERVVVKWDEMHVSCT